jgi:hypothetical protein
MKQERKEKMPKRNKFSRSHYNLLTMNMGELIPIYCDEVIPGDIWRHRTSALIRCTPQLHPVMHPVNVRIHSWFVPLRLIWDDYEDFFTGGNDGDQTPTHPYINLTSVSEGSLYDYLGFPPGTYTFDANALFLRAYNKIYNEHYRDQDLCTETTIDTTSGEDTTTTDSIQKVSWEKDRLTTCRGDTQRGSDVSIPLSGDMDVVLNSDDADSNLFRNASTGVVMAGNIYAESGTGKTEIEGGTNGVIDPNGRWDADVSTGGGITLEDLRLTIGKQRYMEIMQRAGARYGEYARAIFGVNNPDARLQIPEYLGGGRQTISFSEVIATADDDTTGTVVGGLKGHGIAAIRTRRYKRFFPEHGIVMSLMSVVPRAIYTQAIERQLIRGVNTVKEDYFVPQLQGIGDDEIFDHEVYVEAASQTSVFGYQNRYEEYRTKESRVSGEMNSDPGYDRHMGRVHASEPSLNQSFIECNPTKRCFSSTSVDSLQVMVSHSIQARRPIGKTGLPSKL